MSSFNYLDAMRRHNEIIYHQAESPDVFYDCYHPVMFLYGNAYDYNTYQQSMAIEDTPSNSRPRILDYIRITVLNRFLPFLLSIILFLWSLARSFFWELYNIVTFVLLFLPHKFPILSFYPFPYSLWVVFLWYLDFSWVVFLWFLDFLALAFLIFHYGFLVPACTLFSFMYMLLFDLVLAFFKEI